MLAAQVVPRAVRHELRERRTAQRHAREPSLAEPVARAADARPFFEGVSFGKESERERRDREQDDGGVAVVSHRHAEAERRGVTRVLDVHDGGEPRRRDRNVDAEAVRLPVGGERVCDVARRPPSSRVREPRGRRRVARANRHDLDQRPRPRQRVAHAVDHECADRDRLVRPDAELERRAIVSDHN